MYGLLGSTIAMYIQYLCSMIWCGNLLLGEMSVFAKSTKKPRPHKKHYTQKMQMNFVELGLFFFHSQVRPLFGSVHVRS